MNHLELVMHALKQMDKCPKNIQPKVGCVIALDTEVLAVGHKDELQHAERNAIEKLDFKIPSASSLYTTLEPCVAIKNNQKVASCTDLIVNSGFSKVWIGTYDPNGIIYTNGSKTLREKNIEVGLFPRKYQKLIQENTYKYNNFNRGIGGGKRRLRVTTNGKPFTVQFSETDCREESFTIYRLSSPDHLFDITGSSNSIRFAQDATTFTDISDPLVYHDANHFARISTGQFVTVSSKDSKMAVVLKLVGHSETDLVISWQVRSV